MSTVSSPAQPATTRLEDYRPPIWLAPQVELLFELHADHALVTSTVVYERSAAAETDDRELWLNGVDLELVSINLDGVDLRPEDYQRDGPRLGITPEQDAFALQIVTRIRPHENTTLEGLYRSGNTYCTQMEAQGFRRVTWFQDRPDVLSVYTTTIVADRESFPVLLANGNLTASCEAEAGRHSVTWHDPIPKPCYLFALVAGDLSRTDESFTTASGRAVSLQLFVDKGNEDKTAHAMASLVRSMRWDEQAFGREYDLDIFMIVAVSEFNMGAMENKGLNLFNDQLVLARPDTATDIDFHRIEGVIGHEYFHNWSGNRVTCRDWFQLSLKEGLTVFRDQEFSADMGHRAVQRIADVRELRARQFPEDAGPLAHPVRPRAFITIDNFYTTTIYEKGAEVIRMISTLLGSERFRAGTDLYFERHDGQAVTTEEFVRCMEESSGVDLTDFRRWYEQAGTPRLKAIGHYDAERREYELILEQSCPATPGQPTKQPFHIPVALGLMGPDGADLPLRLEGEASATEAPTTRVLQLRRVRESFRFVDVPAEPVPSLLRGFSAPVRLVQDVRRDHLLFQAQHDSDLFSRWEAGQRLGSDILLEHAATPEAGPRELPEQFVALFGRILADESLSTALRAEALALPQESVLGDVCETVHVEALHDARRHAVLALGRAHRPLLLETYNRLHEQADEPWSTTSAGARALKNLCLEYLVQLGEPDLIQLAVRQGRHASNMTDELASLELLAGLDAPERAAALERFKQKWIDEPLVMNKWFAAQAKSGRRQVVEDVAALADDPAFDSSNPNKVRALYRTFAQNPTAFHRADGRGYELLADVVLDVDTRNPVLAGRLAALFNGWTRYDAARQSLMQTQLRRILDSGDSSRADGLSDNLFEIATKVLA